MNTTFADLQQQLSEWRGKLLLTPTKTPKAILANAVTALREAPEWQGVLAYDEFALTITLLKPPPWRKSEDNNWTPQRWTDRDDALTANWLQHNDIGVTVAVAATAAATVAKDNSFHPVRDYLTELKWDGTKRVEHFAAQYLGAEDTPYHRSISKCTLVSAVARIMQPGCKADHVLILEGPQGIGKSTSLLLLFEPWFSDEIGDLGSKDAAMQLSSIWCIELAELSSMTRSEIERVKAFVSRRTDRFRPSYGRHVIEVPRQVIRRYYKQRCLPARRNRWPPLWPARCGSIKPKLIKRDRDQLWAEAFRLYNDGASWWPDDKAAADLAREQQDDRYLEDPWHDPIAKYVDNRESVSSGEIFTEVLGIFDKKHWTRGEQMRVAQCLKALGWDRYRTTKLPREWRYRPAVPS